MLEVGRIAKPHGLRGEVVVELISDRTERLAPGSTFVTDDRALEVVAARPHQDRWIVSFAGVVDREGAEALRGTVLEADAIDDPEELWVHRVIGARVEDLAGRACGAVEAVQANPAADLLVLDTGALVPASFVLEQRADGVVVIDPPEGLLDLNQR